MLRRYFKNSTKMKYIFATIVGLLVCSLHCYADDVSQTAVDSLNHEMVCLQTEQQLLKNQLLQVSQQVQTNYRVIDSLSGENIRLQADVDALRREQTELAGSFKAGKDSLEHRLVDTNSNVQANQSALQTSTFIGLAIALLVVIALIALVLYQRRRNRSGSSSIDEVRQAQQAAHEAQEQLQTAQQQLQEQSLQLDNKLLELLERETGKRSQEEASTGEPDHSLAQKVADEIIRIEINLSRMDASIRGHRQLSRAVQRIKDNFAANGYEIVDMLGKPYNEGMKVVANFVMDENLELGQRIITGITKPQINYNDRMIQTAQITVSQNI